jgi:hypothetical protein
MAHSSALVVYLYYFAWIPPWPAHSEFGAPAVLLWHIAQDANPRLYRHGPSRERRGAAAVGSLAETGNPGAQWKPASGENGL